MERPEVVQEELETPFGRGQMIHWGNSALFRTGTYYDKRNQGDDDEPVPCLTINGVEYGGRIDLAVYDGEWQMYREKPDQPAGPWNNYHAIGLSRQDRIGVDDITDAARRKVREELVPWLIEHVKASPELVLAGHRKRLDDAAERARRDLELAQGKLDECQAELARIEGEYETITRLTEAKHLRSS